MTTYMRSAITPPPARPLVHTNPESGSGMRCHGPGCGGSPHDIEHRYFTWSGGARACSRGCLATIPIPGNQREYDIQHGLVDLVAHTMTITCGRLRREDFSSVYFDAHQRVLVPKSSKAPSLADLRGQKVCSMSVASSIAEIVAAKAILVPVAYWTDCLVLLQQGDAAAISTGDCILKGLESQDPWTELKRQPGWASQKIRAWPPGTTRPANCYGQRRAT